MAMRRKSSCNIQVPDIMKIFPLFLAAAFCLLNPFVGKAQSMGRIECARNDGYVYLYSDIATLDVRATVQCGEIVQITGRFETYYGARTAKGDAGYIPVPYIVLLKDQPGAAAPQAAPAPARERMSYDERPAVPVGPAKTVPPFTLAKDTLVRVRLLRPLSSASAHTGDAVEFEVLDDIVLDGVTVIAKGSKATGAVAEVELKKHFGHDGKISFSINWVTLADNEKAPVRFYFEAVGSSTLPDSSTVQLRSGKDAVIPQGAEYTVRIDGNVPLNRESFVTRKPAPAVPASTSAAQIPASQR
jgi:hypothetical protein